MRALPDGEAEKPMPPTRFRPGRAPVLPGQSWANRVAATWWVSAYSVTEVIFLSRTVKTPA
ncbi:hypothetical protein BG418_12055 [Streptomyces sp. CBMA152]|nr:hypothetical protein [Streptomyces sp. CBMA152]